MFKYPKASLTKLELTNPPYGECFVAKLDETGTFLACGYSNGFVNIFNVAVSNQKTISFRASDYPITSLKWNSKLKTILIVVSADGSITHWHTTSGKILHTIKEKDNAINCVDYAADYRKFVTGGNDVTVRVYDEGMKTKVCEMSAYKFEEPGHSGRIFCVKFNPENKNTVISGGWDKTIQFYDVREGKIVNSIYGPHICGEALDINGYYVLSGSWSTEKQLQLWDTRTLECVCDIPWEHNELYQPTYIYSVKFNSIRDKRLFGVGGVNRPLYRIFDYSNFSAYRLTEADGDKFIPKVIFSPKAMYTPCYSVDFAKISGTRELMVCGCGDGGARVYTVQHK